jgi:hypothetical protein
MDSWDDWLRTHWYQVGVLILLAIIAFQASRAAGYLAIVLHRLRTIEDDISGVRSTVDKWELSWRVDTDKRWMVHESERGRYRP